MNQLTKGRLASRSKDDTPCGYCFKRLHQPVKGTRRSSTRDSPSACEAAEEKFRAVGHGTVCFLRLPVSDCHSPPIRRA